MKVLCCGGGEIGHAFGLEASRMAHCRIMTESVLRRFEGERATSYCSQAQTTGIAMVLANTSESLKMSSP